LANPFRHFCYDETRTNILSNISLNTDEHPNVCWPEFESLLSGNDTMTCKFENADRQNMSRRNPIGGGDQEEGPETPVTSLAEPIGIKLNLNHVYDVGIALG
jgi:hypothetical protein